MCDRSVLRCNEVASGALPHPRLAALFEEVDNSTGVKALKKMNAEHKKDQSGTVMEIKQLDRACLIAFGQGLERFIPSYFAGGVTCLCPGTDLGPLPPLHQRPMLRIVSDRETSNTAAQAYLTSRCRVLEVTDPFHILWRIALQGLNKAGCRGTLAILTTAINAWKGPWMNGSFGRELQEALVFILGAMHPTHPFLHGELSNVLTDHGIEPDDLDHQTPDAQMRLLSQSSSFLRAGTWVQWRRFFCFHQAFPELDKSWTARLVCGRFVVPRLCEFLFRADARIDDPAPVAGAAGEGPMSGAEGPVAGAAGPHHSRGSVAGTANQQPVGGIGCPGPVAGAAGDVPVDIREDELVRQAQGKEALRAHRERHGNMLELSTDALGNRELQYLGRHIYYSTLPLFEHYLDSIPSLTSSQMSVAQWHARRAAGDWQHVSGAILSILSDFSTLDKCGTVSYTHLTLPTKRIV